MDIFGLQINLMVKEFDDLMESVPMKQVFLKVWSLNYVRVTNVIASNTFGRSSYVTYGKDLIFIPL